MSELKKNTLQIKMANREDIPLDLLLEAEPSIELIEGYPSCSKYFTVYLNDRSVAVCVVFRRELDAEILNISTYPNFQKQGIGQKLMIYVVDWLQVNGVQTLSLGTGSFGYQLTFYQRLGFRVVEVERD